MDTDVLEPARPKTGPEGFFDAVRINDPAREPSRPRLRSGPLSQAVANGAGNSAFGGGSEGAPAAWMWVRPQGV